MKMKRFLGTLLSIALMLGLMMGMSTTVYADIPQSGSNEYVGYRASSNGFDVYGKTNEGAEISTTFNNGGYKTVMQVGASVSLDFSDFAFGKEYSSDGVNASITASVSGKSVFVAYELKNNSAETKTVKIGSWADSQIKGDDSAPCSFTENGIKMTSIVEFFCFCFFLFFALENL